ncbi:hypothetical protein K2Z83_11210 [Oscillochloris sp. ZM17-4]|uniref:hypothetical protein n=1 Tax=Oscillochloris sp. ZM17-4 TaxID=2866714 RepID=UPI001C72DEFF|nr:hypothetical protein [Oscillochloris sp. ZM17-4]MBX0328245.1 hypothetical protein [Oscillochloris sp. ZM17-4]
MEYLTAGILTGMSCVTLGYAALLDAIHDRYTPDHIWVTVAGGFVIVGAGLWLWLWLVPPRADQQFDAFWRFAFLTCTAGFPIIAWQLGQNRARRSIRRRDGISPGTGKASGGEIVSGSGGQDGEDARRP